METPEEWMTMDRPRPTRRDFLRIGGAGGGLIFIGQVGGQAFRMPAALAAPGGLLDATTVPKFQSALLIPPVMPRSGRIPRPGGPPIDEYVISVRQFEQQVLPEGLPTTTVWGYGPVATSRPNAPRVHNAPSFTIEAQHRRPVRVTWVNDLVDEAGHYLPHLLPVDPTLHWANPPGGEDDRDSRPTFEATPGPYTGPVPIVTHVHGAFAVGDESDGYPEAWFLPRAHGIPEGWAAEGTWYRFFADKAQARFGVTWEPGSATFQYPNTGPAATLWYHDHTLGMTRLNVYAGPAGFYLLRGGPMGDHEVRDSRTGGRATLPGPAPRENDAEASEKQYREIPLAIQDRSFAGDGSLFYPDTRAFFDGIEGPYVPESDISPMWNPEFFGNTIIVNGATWPRLEVEQRRYRFRVLNGCQSRFLILDFGDIPGVSAWAIGNEGGFLDEPVDLTSHHANRLLLGPAERADLVVDFTDVPVGDHVLRNVGPDEPFGGGVLGADFFMADPATTGQVMQFGVGPARGADTSTPPQYLRLPRRPALPEESATRPLALVEEMSMDFDDAPAAALLGTVSGDPTEGTATTHPLMWHDPVSENPDAGATEVWELFNTTADAHPIHIHETLFEVVDRQEIESDEEEPGLRLKPGSVAAPEPWETGVKDTVVAYPGQVTRVRARFTGPGQFVWHCHIVEHEDNEMMRPYRIGPPQPDQPG
jgi:spore coat protein A